MCDAVWEGLRRILDRDFGSDRAVQNSVVRSCELAFPHLLLVDFTVVSVLRNAKLEGRTVCES